MSKWRSRALGEVCEINPKQNGAERLPPSADVTFVPMAAVDESSGTILGAENRTLGDISGSYTPFRDGDVLFAKITPCMENGKAAIARGLANGCGFGSTEFHVLRCRSEATSVDLRICTAALVPGGREGELHRYGRPAARAR